MKDKGWVIAKDLINGDLLEDENGQYIKIDDIIISKEPNIVYNFEVEDFHTYYVSNLGIWTHNTSNCNFEKIKQYRIDATTVSSNKLKGDLGEDYADTVFAEVGYTKLPSKVGSNNGFDGLFVKYDSDGKPIDIIINESKFGSSKRGKTVDGYKQMDADWIEMNIQKMKVSSDPATSQAGYLLENNPNLIRTKMNRLKKNGINRWSSNPGGFGR